jgi:hypothetical protein
MWHNAVVQQRVKAEVRDHHTATWRVLLLLLLLLLLLQVASCRRAHIRGCACCTPLLRGWCPW